MSAQSARRMRRAFAIAIAIVALCAVAVVVAVALGLGQRTEATAEITESAWADESGGQAEVLAVSLRALGISDEVVVTEASDVGTDAQLISRLCPTVVTALCLPESVELGIDCGMEWMCGLAPCLCGAADSWGYCACNGTETIEAVVSWSSSDESVVRVVNFAGHALLVPTGEGEAVVTCTASLPHYADAAFEIVVRVDAPTLADALVVLLAVIGIGLVAGFVVVLVRRCRAGKGDEQHDEA